MMDTNFVFNDLFLSDILNILSFTSCCLQISDKLPWLYANDIDLLNVYIERVVETINTIVENIDDVSESNLIKQLPIDLFPNLKTYDEVLDKKNI